MASWHDDDQFWEIFAPKMFSTIQWQAAPFEIDRVIAFLDLKPGAPVLDLCCGPGRHSLEMARRGLQVTGVDRTANYLAHARDKAAQEGLDIEFIQEDMRRFSREHAFDGAIMMYTSFGYFKDPYDNLGVLANVYHSLNKNGALIIETMGKEVLARIFQPRNWSEEDGVLFLEERKIRDDWQMIENRWIRIQGQERREFGLSHWIYSAVELHGMLVESGFSQISFYGDLEGAPYDENARRLVAVACK